jgi:hypothetical protein
VRVRTLQSSTFNFKSGVPLEAEGLGQQAIAFDFVRMLMSDHRVHHHENEFARGKRHINGIESFWSFAKTRLAKQRGVRADKFSHHLKESEWRWNHRLDNLYSLLLKNTRSHPLN